jgi:uncharacterized protein YfaS (alpha-2-macroglobulin family)
MMLGLVAATHLAFGQETAPGIPPASIDIGHIQVQEGSDFFAIEVQCYVRSKKRSSDNDSCNILAAEALDHIAVEPRVEFQVMTGRGHFRLVGDFAPRTAYTLTFLPGLRTDQQAVLLEQVQKKVQTPGLKPMLRFLGRARYLPPLKGATLPFEARNIERLHVSFRQVFPQNLIFWLTKNQEETPADVAAEVASTELRLPPRQDEKITHHIDLDTLAQFGQGVFQVIVERDDNVSRTRLDSATVVITNIAAVAKEDGDDLYVWTRSAVDMRARPDVQVQAMSYNNRPIASCTTNGDNAGCVLKGLLRQRQKPYALILTAGHDLSYLRFSDVEITDERVHAGLRPYVEAGVALEAYVYSSRGVYRPGETVNLGAAVWTTTRQAAQGLPLQWQILTPRNKVLKEVSVKSSPFGLATLDVKLDTSAPTGKYQAILKSGDKQLQVYGFFVEDFVPERIGVKVTATEELFVGTAGAAFDIAAAYLFGPPVASGDYTVRCTLEPAWFTVPGNTEFATGTYQPHPPRPIVLEPITGTLNDQGQAAATCPYEQFLRAFPTVMQVKANVEIVESGSGRVTLKSGAALAAATDEIIGLRLLRAANNQLHLEGRLFSPTGEERRRDTQVLVSLHRVVHNFNYVWDAQRGDHRWQREEILLPEGTGKPLEVKQGRFDVALTSQSPYGAYVVRARLADQAVVADARVSLGYSWFWDPLTDDEVYTSGTKAPRPSSPDRLKLLLSQREVPAGSIVKVRFEAPFSGHLLLAVESDRLLGSRWVAVRQGPQEFDIKAPAVLPNVYVSALLLKEPLEGDFYVPARAWGSVPLKIVPQAHVLHVEVDVPDEIRPQQELAVRLRAQPGEKAQFTVAVVDEGILQLTDFKTPDPLRYFFEPRRLGVHTYETIGWTLARTLESSQDPGGGEAGASKPSAVIPVTIMSYWSGIVESDDHGTAVVRVPIPQFQGKVRVMVVGAAAGRSGSAERFVTVRDPLVLQATLPRFLIWKDVLSIPIFVVNTTGEAQDVTVTVRTNDAIAVENASVTGTVEHLRSSVFHIPARVQGFTGVATFDITASGGAFTTTTREHFNIPIIPFTPEKTVATTVPAGSEVALADVIPTDLRPEGLRFEISVSTIPFLQELGHLRYLLHYPYG